MGVAEEMEMEAAVRGEGGGGEGGVAPGPPAGGFGER